MKLKKYSFGVGDRFAQQGKAQLSAFLTAQRNDLDLTPVWNKSYREHKTVHTTPSSVRHEADHATNILNWENPYFVDADHINMSNVDDFLEYSDFFTIDVANKINTIIDHEEIEQFVKVNSRFIGRVNVPGIEEPYTIGRDLIWNTGEKFLSAIKEAAIIYQYIRSKKGTDFVAEVSMDEVDDPQSPVELLLILSGLAYYGVEVQTIAPKFTGRFNKGVDYVGDLDTFKKEFEEDILVIDFAIHEFRLPDNLKLSVHSGSDKFSIYPLIHEIIQKYDRGVHVKTAGTTWLEEIAGLALSDGSGLEMAKNIYIKALGRYEELTGPYSTVIDIDVKNLPTLEKVRSWNKHEFAQTLRHDPANKRYNPEFRQLLHVAYKIAAEYGRKFLDLVKQNENIIDQLVTDNIYINHIEPIFSGNSKPT